MLVLSIQVLSKVALVINYHVNQAEITRKYCENKAKPKLQCNGKCHLAKQLAKQEKQEKPSSETNKFKLDILDFTANISSLLTFNYPALSLESNFNYHYSEFRSDSYLDDTFHPPANTFYFI